MRPVFFLALAGWLMVGTSSFAAGAPAGCGKTISQARTSLVRTSGTSPVCLVHLVYLVDFVYLVYLVGLVQPNIQDKPNKQNKRDRPDRPNRPNEQDRLARSLFKVSVVCVNIIVRMWRRRFLHSTGFDRQSF
jgi:hypothetical protein